MIKEIFEVSKEISPRTRYEVLSALMEEVGELSTEISISEGYSKKRRGSDGVTGECVDVILCAVDMIYVQWKDADPESLAEHIQNIIKAKLEKWKTKQQSS